MVKTRSALQLIFEVPLEQQERVMAALGTPLPGTSNPVAIARLRAPGAEPTSEPIEVAPEPELLPPLKPRKSMAQIAGILCSSGAFQKFVGAKSEQEAADYIRGHCEVASRAEIDASENATRIFNDIRGEFNAWMAAPDAYSPREEKDAA